MQTKLYFNLVIILVLTNAVVLLTGMTEFAKEKFSKEKCLTAAVAECIMGEQPDAL